MPMLDNGAVLPHGLLSESDAAMMGGFNKTYRNFPLRIGVVVQTYPVSDPVNSSKLTTEYDVLVIEQNEDRGATSIRYRNCMSSEGMGSIADFFEKTLRKQTKKTTRGDSTNLKGQDGAIVLLLCLDGMSDKGIIISAITHPDRQTTLTDDQPYLQGEYNGVNIVVNSDGSATMTWKGPTNNDGSLVDSSMTPTTLSIEKDGSYQVSHSGVTQRFDKKGVASLTATDNITNTTQKDFIVTAQGNMTTTSTKDTSMTMAKYVMNASGSATITAQEWNVTTQSSISYQGSDFKVQASSSMNLKAPTIVVDGQVSLGGQGGQPVLLLSSMFIGTGNLGIPVISNAISGYAVKVMAQ